MHRSIFNPLIKPVQNINSGETSPDGRLLTIPTVTMTVPRPFLGLKAGTMLLLGEHPVTPLVALTFGTDMEGTPGRLIDRYFPSSRLGTSETGAKLDIVADTGALAFIGAAGIVAPRMPMAGRAALAIVAGHEGIKSAWALKMNKRYRQHGARQNLYIRPTDDGKASMFEKMFASGLAVLSSDFDSQRLRQPIAAVALAFAVIGVARGEEQRGIYREQANNMVSDLGRMRIPGLEELTDSQIDSFSDAASEI